MSFFGIVGACVSVYVGIRLVATVVDIIQDVSSLANILSSFTYSSRKSHNREA